MVFKNIAISGRIAVGVSTLAKQLSQVLGWPLRDASQIFRDISMHSGFDLEKNPQKYADGIDLQVDGETILTLKSPSNIIVTSKLAGFLSRDIGHTLRVLITCPQEKRIYRYATNRGYPSDKAKELLILREKMDQEKWERLYGKQDFFAPANFHLIINSGKLRVEEETGLVLRHLNPA
jgi:cytidylate kinase